MIHFRLNNYGAFSGSTFVHSWALCLLQVDGHQPRSFACDGGGGVWWRDLLLMEEILHHRGCTKLWEKRDTLRINWCRNSSINSKKGISPTTSTNEPAYARGLGGYDKHGRVFG